MTLLAEVTGTSPSGTVTFMEGATVIGTATLVPYVSGSVRGLLRLPGFTGTRVLSARYGGDSNNTASESAPVTVTAAAVATAAGTTTSAAAAASSGGSGGGGVVGLLELGVLLTLLVVSTTGHGRRVPMVGR